MGSFTKAVSKMRLLLEVLTALLYCRIAAENGTQADSPGQKCITGYELKDSDCTDSNIIGGNKAIAGGFPWQAHFVPNGWGGGWKGFCGATIISAKWLVTAAHCAP